MVDTVTIVGLPNVGKSTLFNRFVSRKRALVHDTPGTTVDYIEAAVEWDGKRFIVVDTGGWLPNPSDKIHLMTNRIIERLVAKSAVVLLVMDAKAGVTHDDEAFAKLLRRLNKNIYLVVNKVDSVERESSVGEFYKLGFENVFDVSALSGRNINAVLDSVAGKVVSAGEKSPAPVKIIILGRPNAGKSTLLNRLISEERNIVDERPGTTRESIDVDFTRGGRKYRFIDTPGITRKRKYENYLEYLSYLSMNKFASQADVAILLIDAAVGITKADESLAGIVKESDLACLVAINKWDTIGNREEKFKEIKKEFIRRFSFLSWAEFITISALKGLRTTEIFEKINSVYDSYIYVLNENDIMEILRNAMAKKSLVKKGKKLVLKGIRKISSSPPTVDLLVSNPEILDISYRRYLINSIREAFPLKGSPLKLFFRRGSGVDSSR